MNLEYKKTGTRVYSGAKWCRSYGVILAYYNGFYSMIKSLPPEESFESFMRKQISPIMNENLPWIKIQTRKGNVKYSILNEDPNMNEWKVGSGE